MSIFDPDVEPINYTGVPGWELPGHNAEQKREAEQKAILEVQQFEREKQAVNVQVAINESIHGPTELSRHPIEIDNLKA